MVVVALFNDAVVPTASGGQFHEHFTSSFYARRSQKGQKDSQVKQLFALLGSACVKDVRKHVDEIDARSQQPPGYLRRFGPK